MSDAPPALRPLLETVERLWPDASSVELSRRGSGRPPSGAHQLVVAPDASRPRALLPSGGLAARAATRRSSAAVTSKEALTRWVSGTVFAAGGVHLLPDRIVVHDPGDDHVVALLSDVLGEDVVVSIGVGTERANRKPVLGVYSRSGRPLAFAKVGDTPIATGHVLGEAAALEQIASRQWRVVVPPRVVASRSWRGLHVLVLSALSAPTWRGRGAWPIPDVAADEVARAFAGGSLALADTPMWARCTDEVQALTDGAAHERLAAALTAIVDEFGADVVDVGGFHGDFTPWNLARAADRVLLWDWERFDTGVPVGADRLHYAVNTVVRAEGIGSHQIVHGLERAAGRPGSSPRTDRLLALTYLVSVASRYFLALEDDSGQAVRRRAMATLQALEELLGRPVVSSPAGRR